MNTNRVVARSTTLLPNIPGLASILTLLFAPRAEFRTNATRTRLTGAICGLGFDRERNCQSFYPEHDMEIAFDTEIDLNVSSYEFLFTLEVLIIVFFFLPRMCCSSTNRDFGSIPCWGQLRTAWAGVRRHREIACGR